MVLKTPIASKAGLRVVSKVQQFGSMASLSDSIAMFWKDCDPREALRGRRRFRAVNMRLMCLLWSFLLFGAGSLVLLIHLQNLYEMVQQQGTGMKFTRTRECSEALGRVDMGRGRFDWFDWGSLPPTAGSRRDMESPHLTQRHRKLLKTDPVAALHHNSSSSSSSSSSVSTEENLPRLLRIQRARRQWVKELCAKYKMNTLRTIMPHHMSRIYVEDRHKLLYCEVPKAGCSNWKRTLMVLAGLASSTHHIKHDTVHYGNHLRRLDGFDPRGVAGRLDSYTKVLFVREPLERLVSAFRDKFESPNTYYHVVFGKPIVSKYRVNASEAARETGSGVTFREFVRYLLDTHRPVGMDIHWEPVNTLCSPCLLDYNFIGKFETMEEEANFLLKQIGAPKNLMFPSFKDRNPESARTSAHITQRYVSQLSAAERQMLYDFYYMDSLIFNYTKPPH